MVEDILRKRMDNDFYVFLSSDACRAFYPSNKAEDFTVKLPSTLNLDTSDWFCALCEIEFTPIPKTPRMMMVLLDVCQESIVNDKTLPLLRSLCISNYKVNRKSISVTYDRAFYMPVKRMRIDQIRVYIKLADGEIPSLGIEPLNCTLHFKKVPSV